MLEKNHLIIIYGKGGIYKSSLGISLLNNHDNSCYINLEKNNHLKINDKIKVYDEANIDFIKTCIMDYDAILVDYLQLLEHNENDLLELKELAEKENKLLIIISVCSHNKDLTHNEKYEQIRKLADLVILTDKNQNENFKL